MAIPRSLIERLPRLKLIAVTGKRYDTVDVAAATERGVAVTNTQIRQQGGGGGVAELVWGMILAAARHIAYEDRMMRRGGWQHTIGTTLRGKTLGILGLGGIGKSVAGIGQAFGMDVIAWSQNLMHESASTAGVRRVEKDELFRLSDVLTIHVVLSERTRHLVTARELGMMKTTALLINTARGPIIDEAALIAALQQRRIGGAGLDVYDVEPLPHDHPFRRLDNVVLTPHLGYYTREQVGMFYQDAVEVILAFLDGKPIRVVNPKVFTAPSRNV